MAAEVFVISCESGEYSNFGYELVEAWPTQEAADARVAAIEALHKQMVDELYPPRPVHAPVSWAPIGWVFQPPQQVRSHEVSCEAVHSKYAKLAGLESFNEGDRFYVKTIPLKGAP